MDVEKNGEKICLKNGPSPFVRKNKFAGFALSNQFSTFFPHNIFNSAVYSQAKREANQHEYLKITQVCLLHTCMHAHCVCYYKLSSEYFFSWVFQIWWW